MSIKYQIKNYLNRYRYWYGCKNKEILITSDLKNFIQQNNQKKKVRCTNHNLKFSMHHL